MLTSGGAVGDGGSGRGATSGEAVGVAREIGVGVPSPHEAYRATTIAAPATHRISLPGARGPGTRLDGGRDTWLTPILERCPA
ncbi:MAG: hypothetical protein IT299_00220 [Dehalococcoidia bacterium]|nr:hypothetical protein [Dehalococcoidia bacterium]